MPGVYLLLATILWGIWGFAYKAAVAESNPWCVQWLYAAVSFVLFPVGWLYVRATRSFPTIAFSTVAWSVTAAVSALAASTFLLFAMKSRPGSIAVAATSAYPLVTLLIGAALGAERLQWPQAIGVVLIVTGAFFLNWT